MFFSLCILCIFNLRVTMAGSSDRGPAATLAEISDPDGHLDDAATVDDDEPDEPHLEAPGDQPAERERVHNNDAYGSTEIARLRRNYSRASSYQRHGSIASKKPTTLAGRCVYNLKSFWRNQVSITVDHSTCRDHLALERTFLGYLRTSLALSMMGITIAQFFRLQHASNPNILFGFYVLGKPLSCICQGTAIYTLLIGAFRTWRLQNAIVRGKAISGGFEIIFLAGGILLVLVIFFGLLLAVDIMKEDLG